MVDIAMKMLLRTVAILLAALPIASDAQTDVVEIAPIVVTGTFELRRSPPAVDAFTSYLERQKHSGNRRKQSHARQFGTLGFGVSFLFAWNLQQT